MSVKRWYDEKFLKIICNPYKINRLPYLNTNGVRVERRSYLMPIPKMSNTVTG